jgi:anti-sigma factor RsiW
MVLDEMTCRELVEIVTEYLEEALSDRNRLRFEAHLADCPHCLLYLEQMRMTITALGRLRDLPPLPGDSTPSPRPPLPPLGQEPGGPCFAPSTL